MTDTPTAHPFRIRARHLIDRAAEFFAGPPHYYRVCPAMDESVRAHLADALNGRLLAGEHPLILVTHSWEGGEPGRVWFEDTTVERGAQDAAAALIDDPGAWRTLHAIDVKESLRANALIYWDATWRHHVEFEAAAPAPGRLVEPDPDAYEDDLRAVGMLG